MGFFGEGSSSLVIPVTESPSSPQPPAPVLSQLTPRGHMTPLEPPAGLLEETVTAAVTPQGGQEHSPGQSGEVFIASICPAVCQSGEIV